MSVPPPAAVGTTADEIDTPALVIELDAFERNLARMSEAARARGVRLRPHAKTHKSTAIANLQIAGGAVGVCCQKVSEAEILADGGVRDVLVSNEIVGVRKTSRLAALARRASVSVCVDDAGNVAELEAAGARFGATLRVLVELDVGAGRCGVQSVAEAVRLACLIDRAPHLEFAGLQAYHATAQHFRRRDERAAAIAGAVARVEETRAALAATGLPCDTVTGGGTGTFEFELASGVFTEVQAGSYIFMDADYSQNLGADDRPVHAFEQALFVVTTVMSRPASEWAVVDAGLKAFSIDSGPPEVVGVPGASMHRFSDEHTRIELGVPETRIGVGDRLRLVPGHCDPTVNLHDWFVCVRENRVEAVWPVSARGALL